MVRCESNITSPNLAVRSRKLLIKRSIQLLYIFLRKKFNRPIPFENGKYFLPLTWWKKRERECTSYVNGEKGEGGLWSKRNRSIRNELWSNMIELIKILIAETFAQNSHVHLFWPRGFADAVLGTAYLLFLLLLENFFEFHEKSGHSLLC